MDSGSSSTPLPMEDLTNWQSQSADWSEFSPSFYHSTRGCSSHASLFHLTHYCPLNYLPFILRNLQIKYLIEKGGGCFSNF